jgi:hypothetical protein
MYSASMFADWYKAQESIIYRYAYDAICADFKKMSGSDPWWMKIAYAGDIAAESLESIIVFIGGALFDTLALGQGIGEASVGENPAWGIFSDGIRVLALAGPVTKLFKVFSVPAVPRVFTPSTAEVPFCTLMSTANALRDSRIANFASAADLSRALGLGVPVARSISEVVPLIKTLGGAARMIRVTSVDAVKALAQSRPGRVFLVDLRWKNPWWTKGEAAHTLCVQWVPEKGSVMFLDPSGAFGQSLQEVEQMILRLNPQNQQMVGMSRALLNEAAEIEHGLVTLRRGVAAKSLAEMIGLEMLSLTIGPRKPIPGPGPSPPAPRSR